MSRRGVHVLAIASVVFAAFALRQAWTDAPTYDEPTYLVSGLTAWTRHDLRINRQHPPLGKQLASLPVLALHPTIPRGHAWTRGDERALSRSFVRAEIRRGQLQRAFFVARLVPIAEGIAIGWLLALLAARLFGAAAAVLSGLLWLLIPVSIGLSHLDGIDVPFTLTVVATALAVAWARDRPTTRRCALVGLCAGLSMLTRITGLFVVPAAALAVAAVPGPVRVRRAAVVAASSWLVLVTMYAALAPSTAASGVVGTIGNLLVPVDWRRGSLYLLRVGSQPGPAFLLGRFHIGRWPIFWLGSLLVKLPPLTFAAIVAMPIALTRLDRRARRSALWVIGLPAVALVSFTLQQERPLGIRYLLAPLALAIVGAGALATTLRDRAARAVTASIAVGGLLACASPALAWTTPLVRRPGYEVAADSNLDWGQGFYALQSWARGKHPWVAYFGGAGLDVRQLPGARSLGRGVRPASGWAAVSISELVDYRRRDLSWLRGRCRVEVLDETILVYDLGRPEGCGCAHVSGSCARTRRNTRVTPRSSASANAGSVSVHRASIGSRWRATGDRLTTT
jgi:4-amino-4-deoxy-L-arabinose transferase-like glycosyltransferase